MADVLVFVEDPGAANFVADLPVTLARQEVSCDLFTLGIATTYLQSRGVHSRVLDSESVMGAFAPRQPRLVVVGTSENRDTPAFTLIAEARRRSIPSVGIVDMQANAEFRFRGRAASPLAHAPNRLVVPDERTRDAFTLLGYPAENIAMCGFPHVDAILEAYRLLTREDRTALQARVLSPAVAGRKVAVFMMENAAIFDAAGGTRTSEYTLHGRGAAQDRVSIVIEEFLDAVAQLPDRPFLVLRPHPKNTAADYTQYVGEFDMVSQGGPSAEILAASDLVVGLTSMVLLEAAACGVPTMSIVPRPAEQAWLPTAPGIAMSSASRRDAIRSLLPTLLERGSRHSALLPERASDRLADAIVAAMALSRV